MGSFVVLSFGNVPIVVENIRAESASANHARKVKSLKGNTVELGLSQTLFKRAGD